MFPEQQTLRGIKQLWVRSLFSLQTKRAVAAFKKRGKRKNIGCCPRRMPHKALRNIELIFEIDRETPIGCDYRGALILQ